jgi:PKD repeat protein
MNALTKTIAVTALVVTASACTIKETEAPPLSGPSEFALRIALSLAPDAIYQDGVSQTVLNIEATGIDSRPIRGLAMKVDVLESGVVYDLGSLSTKNPVTGDDGRARVTYTAPPRELDGPGRLVTFLVTPIGSDYRGEEVRTVDLRLMPPGIILPPNGEPVPDFTFSPTAPRVMDVVNFDASATLDEGVRCGNACTYSWAFGDRGTSTGMFTTHLFREVGTYQVLLTVTDQRGISATVAKSVAVEPSAPPTAEIVFSPTEPFAGDNIFWSAEASTAGPGRRIVSYEWNFGFGTSATGVTVRKGYDTPGTYVVILKVRDDAGQVGTATAEVTVLPRP